MSAAADLEAEPADLVVGPYVTASWWQPEGRRKVIRRLERRGFPSLAGWLFFTLTVDFEEYGFSEVEAFEAGKDRIRRVIFELRELGYEITRYFAKLELHESGYPHWHLGVDTPRYIGAGTVAKFWRLGFVKVKRIRGDSWRYLLKYVVKGNGPIPDWVLDYPKRIRVFQTSVGFFDSPTPAGKKTAGSAASGVTVRSLREKFEAWEGSALVRPAGVGHFWRRVRLREGFRRFFCELACTPGRFVDGYTIGATVRELLSHVIQYGFGGNDPPGEDGPGHGSDLGGFSEVEQALCPV